MNYKKNTSIKTNGNSSGSFGSAKTAHSSRRVIGTLLLLGLFLSGTAFSVLSGRVAAANENGAKISANNKSSSVALPKTAATPAAKDAMKKTTGKRQDESKTISGGKIKPVSVTSVNFRQLAALQAQTPTDTTPGTFVPANPVGVEVEESPSSEDADAGGKPPAGSTSAADDTVPNAPTFVSPAPSTSYLGHSDIPKVGTGSIVIPPDTSGAVGRTNVVTTLNNNYVIQDKTTGATLSAVNQDTFWAPTGGTGTFDPHAIYDPYNNRWVLAITSNASAATSSILVGVSQTADPLGSYYLYRFIVGCAAGATGCNASGEFADYPMLGINKNWIAVSVNMFQIAGTGANVNFDTLVLDYPQARSGTAVANLFRGAGIGFCNYPVTTFSTTEETLFFVKHLSSGGATYAVSTLTGTPSAPSFSIGATKTRPGGGWAQPGGNILPQAAPVAGASACAPLSGCFMDAGDAQVRNPPVYRDGFLYYAQTIGLPAAGLTHTAAQWTKLDSVTGNFLDGGRVEDPTATSANGGKWYAYPSITANFRLDVMMGFTQFSSAQYPSAGYTFRSRTDTAGTMRDPFIYKAGEDYYHKTFGGTRNRFGDYSVVQIDPSDDFSIWALQEYSMARVGTDDGNTGSNSSRWSTWWAKVSLTPTAATTTVGGRVRSANGEAVARAVVTLVDANGSVRNATTNRLGEYQFTDVSVGETYTLSARAKGYVFAPRVINLNEEQGGIDFTATDASDRIR